MRRWATLVALVVLTAGGRALPDETPYVSLVPWKVLDPGTRLDAPLTLFWVPASAEELRRSPLLTSEQLTLFASRCVAMRVVRIDDELLLQALDVGADLPVAVLADAKGDVVGRVSGGGRRLSVTRVEALVRDELDARTAESESLLDEARLRAEQGEAEAAAAIYERVWAQRCMCPRQGRAADRALKKLKKR